MPTVSGIVVATGGEATGRRTLLEVVDELARPISGADTDVRAHAADAFRAAVRWYNRKGNWPWEFQDEEITLTANNAYSTVTGGIKKPLAMHYLTASGGVRKQRIGYTPYNVFVEKYDMNITGTAETYTIPNLFETGQIRWFPIPSGTDYAQFTYYRVTPVPRNESEALEIPDYITEAYMSRAWYEFLKRLPSEQRPYTIAEARADAMMAFRELSAHVNSPGDRSRQVNREGYGFG